MTTKFIIESITSGKYKLSIHATKRRIQRCISTQEIETALLNGEIIDKKPKDKPNPSFLVLGWLKSGDPLHIKCSIAHKFPKLRIVTIYKPDEDKWESDYKTRKKR